MTLCNENRTSQTESRSRLSQRHQALGLWTHLHGSGVGFDVDDVSHLDFFFLDALVDGGIEFELFGSFDRLEADDDVRDGFSVTAERVLRFNGRDFGDLAFVDFFDLLDSETLK